MAFLKQCTGTVEVTICEICGANAVCNAEDRWYCQDCIAKLMSSPPTEQ